MVGINILGSGTCVPERILTNTDLAELVDTSDEWITTRTGIKERHISEGEPTWFLAVEAGRKALAKSQLPVEDIDLIIVSCLTPDYATPSISCIVQRELGAVNAMTIDINCACSGFVYAVDMARRYLSVGDDVKNVLVIGAEELSRIVDYSDRSSCILFGDGASAWVITASDKLFSSSLGADGKGARFLVSKYTDTSIFYKQEVADKYPDGLTTSDERYLMQDGKEVYKFATKILAYVANKALEKIGLSPQDIDVYVPHQANLRIIQTAASNLGVPMDKFYVNMERYGNTSSASIPIAFNEAVENGFIKRGDKVCLVGFGAGLTYGAVIIEY